MSKKSIKSLDELGSVKRYLTRIGAEPRSLLSAVIVQKQDTYSRDVTVITFTREGVVLVKTAYAPTDIEADAIKSEFSVVKFPEHVLLPNITTYPDEIKDVSPEDIFEFRDKNNQIVMLQVKRIDPQGGKYFLPYTYWDDNEWRRVEPEGGLPLWGLEAIKDNTTIFIHEGVKAGRATRAMVSGTTAQDKERFKAHPWANELSSAAHISWIGGALAPSRTNWAVLNSMGIQRAYIVSDNDKAGISAVTSIAYELRMPTFHLQFTNEWPASFDLADEFPEHMFKVLEEKPRYVGPPFRSCLHPATWATDQAFIEDKPVVTLREHFKDMWAYIEEADIFVCKPMPNIIRQEKILNNMLSSFSHSQFTSELMFKEYSGRTTGLCYRPDKVEQILTQGNSSSINLHIPTLIKSEPGDPKPFLEFMEYMFPINEERVGMERWVATLVARPDIRMEFGVLMVSEATGIGKTTLGSLILAPLVNPNNVGFPRESDIVDNSFNEWVANKRLVIVHEIYSGQSWKAYHNLKSLITDKDISVNQKYQRPYIVENWAHIFACSNSMRALKMEADDRRWFYPEITEERWAKERFTKLRDWLSSGGLGIIKSWAEGYGNYIMPGERSPMTKRKKDMIEGSRSEAQIEAATIAEAMLAHGKPCALAMKDIVGHVRDSAQGKVYESDYELKKSMIEVGAFGWNDRIRIHGRMQYVVINYELKKILLNASDPAQVAKLLQEHLIKPADLTETNL